MGPTVLASRSKCTERTVPRDCPVTFANPKISSAHRNPAVADRPQKIGRGLLQPRRSIHCVASSTRQPYQQSRMTSAPSTHKPRRLGRTVRTRHTIKIATGKESSGLPWNVFLVDLIACWKLMERSWLDFPAYEVVMIELRALPAARRLLRGVRRLPRRVGCMRGQVAGAYAKARHLLRYTSRTYGSNRCNHRGHLRVLIALRSVVALRLSASRNAFSSSKSF